MEHRLERCGFQNTQLEGSNAEHGELVVRRAARHRALLETGFTEQDPFAAITEFAVVKLASSRLAIVAFANY
jgi:hypothetical protein